MVFNPISVSEAARLLGLSPNRVRVLASSGKLPATKIGGRWLVERFAVEERAHRSARSGRPFEPHNAWALLLLASGIEVEDIDPSVRSRLRKALAVDGLINLLPRMGRRAELRLRHVHAGELPNLLEDRSLVRSGISAIGDYGIDLATGREADFYLPASHMEKFSADHALTEAAGSPANVRVRLVPDRSWHFLAGKEVAPFAAVALDLALESDARTNLVGRGLLEAVHLDSLDPERIQKLKADP